MSKRRSKYEDDSSEGDSPPRRQKHSRSKDKSSPKSKWESPEDDRRQSKDRRRERSRDRGETSRYRNDDRNSRRDRDRRDSPDYKRRRESPENRRRRDSPDERYKGRDRSRDDNRRRDRDNSRDRNRSDRGRGGRGGGGGNFRDRRNNRGNEKDDSNFKWGVNVKEDPDEAPVEKEKPNFGLSGALAKEKNTFKGVEIKYVEPPEAKLPKRHWRLYQFKGDQTLQTLHIHRQSAYLIGRDRKICDMPVDHPSASKQHAALQYRLVKYERPDGSMGKRVRPYIIDLGSSNGTFLNNNKIEPSKYYELMEKDVIKFAFSSREYVVLHENYKEEEGDSDDDVVQEEEQPETETTDKNKKDESKE